MSAPEATAHPVSFTSVTELPGSGVTPEALRMAYTRYRLAADLAAGKDVLEVACGPGIGLGYLARRARRVAGGDFDPDNVAAARRHYGDRVEIRQLDAQDLPFPDGSFDVVLLLEAIYFLPDARAALREARRVLRPGGALLICSANRERPEFNPAPYSTRYFSLAELGELLRDAGFEPELKVGFPLERAGWKSRVFHLLRLVAVKLHLIPKTMDGKEAIKRLLHGKLDPLPAELADESAPVEPLTPHGGGEPVLHHKVIYAIGRLP